MPSDRLSGKVALVTGGSRGIGAAIARRLAADGAKVVVNYARSEGPADEVVRAIEGTGGEARAVRADLGDPAQVRPLFEATIAAFGRLDILVNNAGVFAMRPLTEVDLAHYSGMFDVNVRGPLLASAEAARRFPPEGGRIVNISSQVVRAAIAGGSVYSATKAALESMTRVHATELGPKGVTVNAVAPGTTDTEMLREGLPEEARKMMVGNTAMGRLGTPEDIADVVAFLASDDARWVTGQCIDVSGGLRI